MPSKKLKNLQSLKEKLKKALPQQISKVLKNYKEFSDQPVPEDAKGFGAHHSACKSAVVHIETLLKLARWTEDGEGNSDIIGHENHWAAILAEARAAEEQNGDEE